MSEVAAQIPEVARMVSSELGIAEEDAAKCFGSRSPGGCEGLW